MPTFLKNRKVPIIIAAALLGAIISAFFILSSSTPATAVIVDNVTVTLNDSTTKLQTTKTAIDPQAASFTVKIARPTSVYPLPWDEDSTMKVHIVVEVDGKQYRGIGQTSGGIRTNRGEELEYYSFSYSPPVGFFGVREGFPKRLGETQTQSYLAWLELERISGSISTNIEMSYDIAPAPKAEFHNSVAFESSTSAQESGGDGVISVSIDAGTGSNLAAYMGVANGGESPPPSTGTATYDSVSMSELFDTSILQVSQAAAYVLAGIDTGSSNAVSTLDSASEVHAMWVMTMTGVDQSTPAGTAATDTGTGSTATVTVSGEESDDLVVDTLVLEGDVGTVGANQTERETEALGFTWLGGSTQSGADGGVMSWSGFDADWFIGAVVINASTGPVAALDQEGFAFGDDDGSESAHSLDTQDTDIIEELGTKTLRVLVDATDDPASIAYKLKYQKNGSGGYTDVGVGASTQNHATPESGDVTEDGSNSAQDPWSVDVPSANAGDLLIFALAVDDGSDVITSITPPSGQDGETISDIGEGLVSGASDDNHIQVFYTVTTDAWSAGSLSFNPNTSEQRASFVLRIPAGEFDSSTPIGAHSSDVSSATNESNVTSPAFSAGSTDGEGLLVNFAGADQDTISGPPTGWTDLANQDLGAPSGVLSIRDTFVSDSESISAATWTIGSDSWATIAFVVRPPAEVENQIYISTSSNVASGGEDTTARLTAPSGKTTGDFVTGRRWDDENGSDSIDITSDNYTELEWVLTTQSPATTGNYFEFRVYNGDSALDSYSVTPKWTIGTEQEAQTKIRGGSGGGGVDFRGGSGGGSVQFRFVSILRETLRRPKF